MLPFFLHDSSEKNNLNGSLDRGIIINTGWYTSFLSKNRWPFLRLSVRKSTNFKVIIWWCKSLGFAQKQPELRAGEIDEFCWEDEVGLPPHPPPPKINMSPETGPVQKEHRLPINLISGVSCYFSGDSHSLGSSMDPKWLSIVECLKCIWDIQLTWTFVWRSACPNSSFERRGCKKK